MAGRAATAVKPKSTKVRSAAKSTSRVKSPKASVTTDSAGNTATGVAPKTRKRVKAETRTRIYWAVFNQNLKRVAVFEFDQKVEAEKRAEKLTKSAGDHHFIQKIKATVSV